MGPGTKGLEIARLPRIVVAGDTCPIGCNQRSFQSGDARTLLGDLFEEFEQSDLSIANLECPLILQPSSVAKVGPSLGASADCVKGLKAIGIDVVGLANNHIMDHGIEGLRTTIRALREADVGFVGAGANLEEARRILLREVRGVRIGILAMAEHEFGIAATGRPGANPLDMVSAVRDIKAHRGSFECLVVLLHGGNELYPYPRPRLVENCRFLVEQGASAVVCQHSHCVGCMEIYQGAPIVYGQGNFLFDHPCNESAWHEGALICLEAGEGDKLAVRLIPYRQSDGQPGARRMEAAEEKVFLDGFAARSASIRDDLFVANQWESFCRENKRHYLHTVHGKPGVLRRLAGRLGLLHYLDSRDVQRARLNLIRCESHREALITVLAGEAERK